MTRLDWESVRQSFGIDRHTVAWAYKLYEIHKAPSVTDEQDEQLDRTATPAWIKPHSKVSRQLAKSWTPRVDIQVIPPTFQVHRPSCLALPCSAPSPPFTASVMRLAKKSISTLNHENAAGKERPTPTPRPRPNPHFSSYRFLFNLSHDPLPLLECAESIARNTPTPRPTAPAPSPSSLRAAHSIDTPNW